MMFKECLTPRVRASERKSTEFPADLLDEGVVDHALLLGCAGCTTCHAPCLKHGEKARK